MNIILFKEHKCIQSSKILTAMSTLNITCAKDRPQIALDQLSVPIKYMFKKLALYL